MSALEDGEAGKGGEAGAYDESSRPPPTELDDLLEELQVRIGVVRGTRGRIHSLLEAVLSVGRGLDVSQLLRRITEAAVALVDAEYGALGVIGDDGELAQLIAVGVTDDEAEARGAPPFGRGLLHELAREPRPLRLADVSRHPASGNFPADRPSRQPFLGMPIRVRGDQVFGNLYLAQKRSGKEFDAEDESVLSTLSVAAGVALENARLYEEARYRQRWMEANAEVTRTLLTGVEHPRVLELILESARAILAADLGVLALPVRGGASLEVSVASGADAARHRGVLLSRDGSFAGAALDADEPVTSVDLARDPRAAGDAPRWSGFGPAVAAPMVTEDTTRGVLLLARSSGRDPFEDIQIAPLPAFAGQAALGMELAERRSDAEHLALLADRDRIAKDLHDLAIQRLFATGMTLQSAVRFVEHPKASERLLRAVDDLDSTIKIIRSTIFGLRSQEASGAGEGFRARVARVVQDATPALGLTPGLRMEGLLDTDVPVAVADHCVAVLGEALSNVARHARADSVEVTVQVVQRELTLRVLDDGVGMGGDQHSRRSGLRNLTERARELGGSLSVRSPSAGGTELVWRVPVDTITDAGTATAAASDTASGAGTASGADTGAVADEGGN
jgi:signal transduction histidine kinase